MSTECSEPTSPAVMTTMHIVNINVGHRRGLLGLVALALLWAALAPALAQAWVGSPRADERVQICTSTGMAWVSLDAGLAAPDDGAAATMTSCDWCLLHAGPGLPPPPEGWPAPSRESGMAWPAWATASPASRLALWWHPQPHAPPRFL
ncbi:hypothetical protein Talka_00053 [Tepidimonas alkaliphilus]|uniref:DUF2946 domain-containing protein n=1 Tax=Tepidimonas alkaliphilus TaxID=2588942 RepID=A0A554WCT1_9BURK|nr:hypothetical protein Talka_00053 [Tepidimonas alkaliphilus]